VIGNVMNLFEFIGKIQHPKMYSAQVMMDPHSFTSVPVSCGFEKAMHYQIWMTVYQSITSVNILSEIKKGK